MFRPNLKWFIIALLIALLAAGYEVLLSPLAYFIAVIFPWGLFALANVQENSLIDIIIGSFVGWSLYVILIIQGSKRKSNILWLVFIVLLVSNVAGCHKFGDSPSRIFKM